MSADSRRMTTIGQLIQDGVIIVHKDGNHGSNYPRANEFGENGVPFLSAKLLDDSGNIDFRGALRLNIEKAKKITFGYIETDDVLLSHNATVGRVAVVPKINEKVLIGTSLTHFRLNKEKLLPEYLAAFFSGKNFQNQLAAVMSQTTRNQVPITSQRNLSVYVPPIEDQRRIANTLGSFDKKIRLNTQTNQTLESIAQTIFKSWFVDFEPVKAKMAVLAEGGTREQAELAAMSAISGKNEIELAQMQKENFEHYSQLAETAALFPSAMVESELGETNSSGTNLHSQSEPEGGGSRMSRMIPEGWEVGTYDQIIEFNPKRSIKKGQLAPYLDMQNVPTSGHCAVDVILREMNSGTKFVNGDTLLARITPCLENGKTAFVDFLKSDETGWGSTEFIVMRMKDDLPTSISYIVARQESFRSIAIQSMTGTSGRQRAEAKVIGASSTVIPPKALLVKFGRISDKHLALASANHKESVSLAELRDSLLPKLLSGEIDLSEIQSEVA